MENSLMPRLYISYSHKDKLLIERLVTALNAENVTTLYDVNLTRAGEAWQAALTKGLTDSDAVLVFITEHSISGGYVMNELGMARGMSKLIIPVIYGNLNIPDFIKDIHVIFWRSENDFDNVVADILRALSKTDRPDTLPPNLLDKIDLDAIDASTRPKKSAQKKDSRNYWLFKMNPETWYPDELKVGERTFFSTYFLGKKRPEYNIYREVRTGDLVMAYATKNYQSVTCIMEVTQPVGRDTAQGESFKMRVQRLIKPGIPLEKMQHIIPEILPKLSQNSKPPELFFRLSEKSYTEILAEEKTQAAPYENIYQPFYFTESNHQVTIDQLDFESDINSFATVIALKKVEPPLAIGLFGNWGSGKSFFMEKLSMRIEEIANSKEAEYIKDVVQVKFNSWHYSDANLWASLITQIFESLHDYATKKQFGAEAIRAIYKDLNITSLQLEETQKKLDANAIEERTLQEKKSTLEERIEQKKARLDIWKFRDFVTIVFSDPYIQQDFENIKTQFKDEKLINNIEQIDEKLSEIDTIKGQLVKSFVLLKKNHKGKWIWVWLLAVLFAVLAWLALGPLKEKIEEFISGGVIATSLILAWLINLTSKLAPYFNKITVFYKRLKSLKHTIDIERQKVKLKEHDEINQLNKDIADLTEEKTKLEAKQNAIQEKKTKLENEIKEIGSGKLLANFLAGKTTDDVYIKQLGIISWVRKDFAKLNELFQKQKTVQASEPNLPSEVQIDRIVLYIDDLDRCNEDVVVKVLEAIHLLLAFPLFVVVVGVDPRWLNNALSEKYKRLFGYGGEKKTNKEKTNSNAFVEDSTLLPGVATSYDYLEKIFQIPFALKPINKTGREKLIQYLIREEMTGGNIHNVEVLESLNLIDKVSAAGNPTEDANKKESPDTPIENAAEKLQKARQVKERLVFSKEELGYMQKISILFGHTPRTINRYINIYRIIKAHGNLKATVNFSKGEFKPIMFMLGIIVGCSVFAEEFVTEISKANDFDEFRTFLDNGRLNEKLKSIIKPFSIDIETIRMEDFKKNIELISRFSFRTLIK